MEKERSGGMDERGGRGSRPWQCRKSGTMKAIPEYGLV